MNSFEIGPPAAKSKKPKAVTDRQCMALWSQIVKLMAYGKCELCGKPAVDSHHMVMRRSSRFLRFSIQNGVALCKGCHLHFHQRESLTLWLWMETERKDDYDFVRANRGTVTKEPLKDVKARLESLLEAAREME